MGKFAHIINTIQSEVDSDQDLYDRAEEVFTGNRPDLVKRALQAGIDAGREAIAVLTKAEQEPELQYFHSYFENGMGAMLCESKDVAEYRASTRGGFVLSRPKPEPFTLVESKPVVSKGTLPYGPNEY